MSQKFEMIFRDNGQELSTAGLNTALGQTINAADDGRFIWVTCANGIGIYQFWGEQEPHYDVVDHLTLKNFTEDGPAKKVKLVTFIQITGTHRRRSTRYVNLCLEPDWSSISGNTTTVNSTTITRTVKRDDLTVYTEVEAITGPALTPFWIAKVDDKMCVSSAAFTSIFVFDIETQRLVNILPLGTEPNNQARVGNSNLHGQNGKVWYVNSYFDDSTPQVLCAHALDGSKVESNIPVRPATTRTWLANGFNEHVYFTNFNGVSVTRAHQDTLAMTRIRTSAFQTAIFSLQNRSIFAMDDAGSMILIDWETDDLLEDYTMESVGTSLIQDPVNSGRIWFTRAGGNQLARYRLNDGDVFEVGEIFTTPPGQPDWLVIGSGISNPTAVIGHTSRTITSLDGAITTRPYLFVLAGSEVHVLPLDWNLKRMYESEYTFNAAIVGGALEYFGEIG